MRACGILMPVFSLPSNYGIGTFGKEAYNFVDFLKKAGQTYWQMLPLNPTGFGDSPYQSFSSAAGNPYFIDLDMLCEDGLLQKCDFEGVDFGGDKWSVDYAKLYNNRYPVLRKAFSNFDTESAAFAEFCKEEAFWLDDYALFMALKDANSGACWRVWDRALRFREPDALSRAKAACASDIMFYKFLQFEFYRQWFMLKAYANENGVKIIGDIPIYVADDSADVWCNPEQFDLDENLLPRVVAGCPPDAFSEDGQLWGMPVYDWKRMKNEKRPYSWWRRRVGQVLRVYDVVRIDHFRGFDAYYCIEYGAENARVGAWREGPGTDLFKYLKKDYGGDLPIIAEDLGFLTESVYRLLEETGFPGMKVLQFAFDESGESEYLPHNYQRNCVAYVGTHDNDTAVGWMQNESPETVSFARKYMHIGLHDDCNWSMIRTIMASVADTAILTMPDLLGLGSVARINTPSTTGGNWCWRIMSECINDWLAGIIYENTKVYGRCK